MESDPREHPNYAGTFGQDGTFYPPDVRTRARQKAHFKREAYRGLDYLLSGQVIFMNGEPASGLPRIQEASEMLACNVPPDPEAEGLAARLAEFVEKAADVGEADPGVREVAAALLAELEPFARFDFFSDADPPGWPAE